MRDVTNYDYLKVETTWGGERLANNICRSRCVIVFQFSDSDAFITALSRSSFQTHLSCVQSALV